MKSVNKRIADDLTVREAQVEAAVKLLDEGATVPFIARYRKEVTGALDDVQLRHLEERLRYLRELEDRRATILNSIAEQGKLNAALEAAIREADSKHLLEDLYLPYKPKRRTKAQIAREAGLEPLALALYEDPALVPEQCALGYVDQDKGIADSKAALDGAKQILMEKFSEDAGILGRLRDYIWDEAEVVAALVAGREKDGAKFADYFEFSEAIRKIPSHRALALFRGRNEGILQLSLKVQSDEERSNAALTIQPGELMLAEFWHIEDRGRAADPWLKEVLRWTWRIKVLPHIETDLFARLRERAEEQAIDVFKHNLKDLLLSAPAGARATIGLDPGLRTGVKVAVVDATGKVLDHCAIYPTAPQFKTREAAASLLALIRKYDVELIAIGNGTASRETDRFVADMMAANPTLALQKVMVNEAGASVYSASEIAATEMPDLDVSIRGAVSIARRLQDPLAELVKIEPKAIGVGQYQHDVNQLQLGRSLDAVVEDCVNAVGVDLNMASVPLLSRVSGLSQSLAGNIVDFRNQHGAFSTREELRKVPRFGDKTFEQAAGFLRIVKGDNPLDATAVHPESYPVVAAIAERQRCSANELLGNESLLSSLDISALAQAGYGQLTLQDIVSELQKPGRDPRPEFKTATFREGIEELRDLQQGMILEGTVTNVTAFGAFVDIGVHQDGLVHISRLANRFVKDPREVVKAGDVVKVKVMDVELERRRIALSMRLDDEAGADSESQGARPKAKSESVKAGRNRAAGSPRQAAGKQQQTGTFASLFEEAQKKVLEKSR